MLFKFVLIHFYLFLHGQKGHNLLSVLKTVSGDNLFLSVLNGPCFTKPC